ncbi:MAG: hypothetical protein HC836_44230 [Richelia sp. RM2_1_2]|nr:hypothetical protein [Richelia sp. RM2_1_2]
MEATDKRIEQKKETWIKNVMRIQGIDRSEAEVMYTKISPFIKEEKEKENEKE